MGGAQSSSSLDDTARINATEPVVQPRSDVAASKNNNKTGDAGLSGMPLVHSTCRKAKRSYDGCVRKWYSEEFMTGGGTLNQEEACGDKFDDYRTCILRGIRREVWDKQGLPPPSDASPLAEVEEED